MSAQDFDPTKPNHIDLDPRIAYAQGREDGREDAYLTTRLFWPGFAFGLAIGVVTGFFLWSVL